MRQAHIAGDKLFVDYAGDTVPVIIDRFTGETHQAQIFVAVMGASNFTYVEATWTQGLEHLDSTRILPSPGPPSRHIGSTGLHG
jgi:transposase